MRLITIATANVEEIQCWMKLEMVVWVLLFIGNGGRFWKERRKKRRELGLRLCLFILHWFRRAVELSRNDENTHFLVLISNLPFIF